MRWVNSTELFCCCAPGTVARCPGRCRVARVLPLLFGDGERRAGAGLEGESGQDARGGGSGEGSQDGGEGPAALTTAGAGVRAVLAALHPGGPLCTLIGGTVSVLVLMTVSGSPQSAFPGRTSTGSRSRRRPWCRCRPGSCAGWWGRWRRAGGRRRGSAAATRRSSRCCWPGRRIPGAVDRAGCGTGPARAGAAGVFLPSEGISGRCRGAVFRVGFRCRSAVFRAEQSRR